MKVRTSRTLGRVEGKVEKKIEQDIVLPLKLRAD